MFKEFEQAMKRGFSNIMLKTKIQSIITAMANKSGPVKAKADQSRAKVMATDSGDSQSILLVNFLKSQE